MTKSTETDDTDGGGGANIVSIEGTKDRSPGTGKRSCMSRLDAAGDLVDESRVPDGGIGKTTNTIGEGSALGAHIFLTGETELAFQAGGADVTETDCVADVDVGDGLTFELDAADDLVTDNHSLSHGRVHGVGIADTTADDRHGDYMEGMQGQGGSTKCEINEGCGHKMHREMTMQWNG